MYRIIIPSSCSENAIRFLRGRGYEVVVGTGTKPEELLAIAPLADAVMARIEQYPESFIARAGKLKVLVRHGVGVDNLPVKEAEEAGVWVANAPYSNCDTVAEATIGMLLCVAMRLVDSDKAMHEGRFSSRGAMHKELLGKRIAVLGFGRIGSRVAQKAHDGLGMEVTAYDHHLQNKQVPSYCRLAFSWEEAVRDADVVSLHMPGDPALKGFFDAKAFGMMPEGSIFLNLARGNLVDEHALADALANGHLWGAALDTYSVEPLPADSPLLYAPNLVMSPHNASHTKESLERMAMGAAENIDDVLSGRIPRTPVNHPAHPRPLG